VVKLGQWDLKVALVLKAFRVSEAVKEKWVAQGNAAVLAHVVHAVPAVHADLAFALL
jgi:hypothetical protein